MTQAVTQNYRGLKTAIIVMGILLVGGTIALVVGMVRQAGRIADHFEDKAVTKFVLPAELTGKILQIQVDGGKLVLLIERQAGQRLVILEMATGKIISSLDPAEAP